MTEFTFTKATVRQDFNGDCEVILVVPRSQKLAAQRFYEQMKDNDKVMVAKIAKKTKRRSLSANAYMWVLCGKIADKIRATKEDVYRKAVRDVGEWQDVPLRSDAVDTWIERWNQNGIGYFAESYREAKQDGYMVVRNYYGSHTYDAVGMSRLVNYIVDEAKELEIETLPPHELERMKGEWNNARENKTNC